MLAEPFFKFIGREKQAAERVRDWLDDQKRTAQVAREPDEERTVAREMQSVADEFGVSLNSVYEAYNELWNAVSLGGERERDGS